MNANEMNIKKHASTRRVRTISGLLKAMLLIYLFVLPLYLIAASVGFFPAPGNSHITFPQMSVGQKLMESFSVSVHLLIAVTFYRLLNLYEQGIFFSRANVRLFRLLSYLAFSNGLIDVVWTIVTLGKLGLPFILFSMLGSPWVVGGLFGILVSHIMDEGCKIQEEQELTV